MNSNSLALLGSPALPEENASDSVQLLKFAEEARRLDMVLRLEVKRILTSVSGGTWFTDREKLLRELAELIRDIGNLSKDATNCFAHQHEGATKLLLETLARMVRRIDRMNRVILQLDSDNLGLVIPAGVAFDRIHTVISSNLRDLGAALGYEFSDDSFDIILNSATAAFRVFCTTTSGFERDAAGNLFKAACDAVRTDPQARICYSDEPDQRAVIAIATSSGPGSLDTNHAVLAEVFRGVSQAVWDEISRLLRRPRMNIPDIITGITNYVFDANSLDGIADAILAHGVNSAEVHEVYNKWKFNKERIDRRDKLMRIILRECSRTFDDLRAISEISWSVPPSGRANSRSHGINYFIQPEEFSLNSRNIGEFLETADMGLCDATLWVACMEKNKSFLEELWKEVVKLNHEKKIEKLLNARSLCEFDLNRLAVSG
jgi:hypothetical protein